MSETDRESQHQIVIRICCELSEEQARLLGDVVNGLLSQYCVYGTQYLEQVLVIPNNCTEQAVNLILEETLGREVHYTMGPHRTRAVAIPVELESELYCFLAFEQGLVEQIEPDSTPHEVMSCLLEEILHVQYYSTTWQLFGRLQPPATSVFQEDLLKTAVFLVDEYLVGRSKASTISDMYCSIDPGGNVEPLNIWYGGDLPGLLEKAPFVLREALTKTEIDDPRVAWCNLLSIVNRYVFEPLVRDAAFRSANALECPTASATESAFYQTHVANYWDSVQKELEVLFEKGLENKEVVVKHIANALESFLEHIGIRLLQESDGQSTLVMDTRALGALASVDC